MIVPATTRTRLCDAWQARGYIAASLTVNIIDASIECTALRLIARLCLLLHDGSDKLELRKKDFKPCGVRFKMRISIGKPDPACLLFLEISDTGRKKLPRLNHSHQGFA